MTKPILFLLTLEPCVACHGVDGYQRKDKWSMFDISLKFWIAAIDLTLAQLKATSTTKHNIYDAHIAR